MLNLPVTAQRWADIVLEFLIVSMIIVIPLEKHTAQILHTALYGALALIAIKLLLQRNRGAIQTPLDLPIAALVCIIVISTVFSTDALMSLKSIKRTLISFLLVYYVSVYGTDSLSRAKRLVFAFLSGSLVISIYGLYAFVAGYGALDGRILSTFYHPNRFANYLMFALAISYSMLVSYCPSSGSRVFLYSVLITCAFAFVLTASRGAAFGLVAGLFAVFGPRDRRVWLALVGVVLVLLVAIPFQRNGQDLSRSHLLECFQDELNFKTALGERPYLWRSGLKMAKDHPIVGTGYGKTFNLLYKPEYAPDGVTQDHSSAHNVLIEVAAELGLVGLAVFLWLHIVIFRVGFGLVRGKDASDNKFVRATAAGILTALIGIMINGMFNYFYRDRLILAYWFLVAVLISLSRLQRGARSGCEVGA